MSFLSNIFFYSDVPFYPTLALLVSLGFLIYNETLAFLYRKTRHLDLIIAKPVLAIFPGEDSIFDDEGFFIRLVLAGIFSIWVWFAGVYDAVVVDKASWFNSIEGAEFLYKVPLGVILSLLWIPIVGIGHIVVVPVVAIWILITLPFFIYALVVSFLSLFVEHPATEEVEKHIRGERVSGRDLAEKLRVRVNFKTPLWKLHEIRKKAEGLSGIYKAHKDIGKGFVDEERRRAKERED